MEAEVEARSLLTSEAVLVEFLNFFSEFRPAVRREAAHVANKIYEGGSVEVVASSDRLFQRGLQLYERRPDKTYSTESSSAQAWLTACRWSSCRSET